MEKYKFYGMVLLTALLIALVSPMIFNVMALQSPEVNALKTMGIDGPFFEGEDATTTYSFQLEGFSKGNSSNYLMLSFNGFDGRVSVPGYPALPYDVHVIEVLGRCVIDEIGVVSSHLSYKVVSLTKKVLPAPNPMFYLPIKNQTLVYEENRDVYARNKHFPGRLVEYSVDYGSSGKTMITMHLYPLQYNPVTSELVVFNSLKVLVKYHIEQYSPPSEKMVIIITSELNETVWPLAEFYNLTIGLPTEIKTTDWIYSSYSEAENITSYSGFYAPVQLNPLYYTLVDSYNWTLALKIISYLNSTNPEHVLLVGGADKVPPSFYYQSEYMSWYTPWWGWIPTDHFYASTDYDLIPERFVGRIPFSDDVTVQKAINKILSWYSVTWPSHPDWMRNLDMTGGYPFGYTYMLGESALSNVTREGYTQMFNTTLLMRTDENYHRAAIQNILRNGEAGWLFMLCHGSGTELSDLLITDGWMDYETLAEAEELLTYPTNHNLPVVTSVACMNGAWDESLLTPEFTPPSFGESLLMSNASGIAYIGSARPAFEAGIYFPFDEGLLNAEFYGATLMHSMLIKAYNSFMGTGANASLGEVFAKGLGDYVNTVVPLFESYNDETLMDILYANIFMLNLMGDPGLKLSVYDNSFLGEQISATNALDPDFMVDSELISGRLGATNGTIPFYKPSRNATIQVIGTGENVSVKIVQTYMSGLWLDGFKAVATAQELFISGKASVTITTNKTLSGLLLFKMKVKGVEARFYITSAGLIAQPAEVTAGSAINVEGFGLNIIAAYEAVLTIGGWSVSYIFVPFNGSVEWSFVAPFFNPGVYPIKISFDSYIPPPPELLELFQGNVTILPFAERPSLHVEVTSGTQYVPDDTVTVRIATLLNGKLTDANLTVNLIKPTEIIPLTPQRISEGEYKLEFLAPSTPATYFVSVRAEICYTLPAFNETAYNIHAFAVTVSFEELKSLIQTGNTELNATITALINNARDKVIAEIETKFGLLNITLSELNGTILQISDKTVEIQTLLGTIEGHIEDINGTTATIVSELGNISLTLGEIQQLVNNATGEIIAEINTEYGLLNITLGELNTTIVQVSAKTVEIRNMLETIEGNIIEIKNGTATIETNVGTIRMAVSDITQEQLPTTTNYSLYTLIATIIVILISATLLAVLIKKPKPSS
jgi:hypothetical protein